MSSSTKRQMPISSRRPKDMVRARRSTASLRISKRQEVAAVCYRIHDGHIEFLLVRTRRGNRWIFPKGGVEPGLTRSQSAALEALEEAGVQGSIDETPFATYTVTKRSAPQKSKVAAYLCATTWLTQSHEPGRKPTWFRAEVAQTELRRNRERSVGGQLGRVIDRAVLRIQRLHSGRSGATDPLQKTYFEASEFRQGMAWLPPSRAEIHQYRPAVSSDLPGIFPMARILELKSPELKSKSGSIVENSPMKPKGPHKISNRKMF